MVERGSEQSATSAQLKADIDAGRTGDKVPGFDPAAAPLGTDEEAGGASPSPEEIAQARAFETGRTQLPDHPNATATPSHSTAPAGRIRTGAGPWLGLAIGVAAALLTAAGYALLQFNS